MRLVLLGPPGAGKGTQARMLAQRADIPQIASGDLLRAAVRDQSALGRQAQSYMDRGELVPDSLVLKMINERLDANDARKGFILDGFPRSLSQAEALAEMLSRRSSTIDRAVAVLVPDEELVRRISGRRTCRKCQAMFHVSLDPPQKENVCDRCGGELYQREDDAEATVRHRLEVYAANTLPLLEYYENSGLLVRVEGLGQPQDVEARIVHALDGLFPKDAERRR